MEFNFPNLNSESGSYLYSHLIWSLKFFVSWGQWWKKYESFKECIVPEKAMEFIFNKQLIYANRCEL